MLCYTTHRLIKLLLFCEVRFFPLTTSAYVITFDKILLGIIFMRLGPSVDPIFLVPTHSCLSWLCRCVVSLGRFMIRARSFLNWVPCSGLVKKSANISSVGQYVIRAFFLRTLSVMKKYRISMCRVFFPLDLLPLLANNMVL